MEFTYGELKQALLCCTVYRDCDKCPLYRGGDLGTVNAGDQTCSNMLMSAAMNCINVMERDLEDANKRADTWETIATKHEQRIVELYESLDRGYKNAKTD